MAKPPEGKLELATPELSRPPPGENLVTEWKTLVTKKEDLGDQWEDLGDQGKE